MGSGPANIQLLLDNHLSDTIRDKRILLAKQVAAVRETVAQLVTLEAHALLADLAPEELFHAPPPPKPVVVPPAPDAGEARGGSA